MSVLTRSIPLVALALGLGAAQLPAQQANGKFQWYLGGHGGVLVFRTPSQTRGGIPMAGGHALITAGRGGLLLSLEEGIGDAEQSAFADPTAPGGVRSATFNDLRKYSAVLMAFPVKASVQPFFGVGVGILHTVNPIPGGTVGLGPDEVLAARDAAREAGSSGFATLVGGLQARASRFVVFGQYQITSSPSDGKLISGATHTLSGGLRFNLGNAREDFSAGGY
jgi:hypothetical protein